MHRELTRVDNLKVLHNSSITVCLLVESYNKKKSNSDVKVEETLSYKKGVSIQDEVWQILLVRQNSIRMSHYGHEQPS